MCESKRITFNDNKNVDNPWLNGEKLHISKSVTCYLSNKFKNYVGSIQMISPPEKVFLIDHKHEPDIFNKFGSLRVANPKNNFRT